MALRASQLAAQCFFLGLLLALIGCSSEEVGKNSEMGNIAQAIKKPPAPAPAPAQTPAKPVATPPVAEQPPAQAPPTPQPAQPQAPPAAAPGVPADQSVVAVVGKKQHPNEVHGVLRYYGAIASARFVMEDRILGFQIQKQLDSYVAQNDGKFPKTNDEYMDKIIHEGMVQLPELPPGQEYFYDPEDHELKIGTLTQPAAGPPAQPQ